MPCYDANNISNLTILDAMSSAAVDAGIGVLGSVALSCIGYGSIAAAAGPLGTIALACGVGGTVILLPYIIIHEQFKHLKHRDRFTHDFLLVLLDTTAALSSGMLGAAILGLAVNPIGLCALAGAVLWNIFKMIEITYLAIEMAVCAFINFLNTPFSQILDNAISSVQVLGEWSSNLFPSFTDQVDTQPSAPPISALFQATLFQATPVETNSDDYPMAQAKIF